LRFEREFSPDAARGDSAVRDEQDREFARAEQDALMRSFERREQRATAEEERRAVLAADADCRVAVRLALEAIGPEPADGVLIVVVFPPKDRVSRRFLPSQPGEHVYAWIENEDFMWRDNNLIKFTLKTGPAELDREKTLGEQGISGRCMLQVFEDLD
jgi:hypothetical protein